MRASMLPPAISLPPIQHVAVKAETPAFVDARASAVAEPQLYFVAGYGERKAIDAIQK